MGAHVRFRILNVFTDGGSRLSGNALCVIEDASALSEAQMQAIALQMNLSETTFLLPPSAPGATARVRIFTPTIEMPFAGHPTLGTAHVVRALSGGGGGGADAVRLEMKAGIVDVTADGAAWTLRTARDAATREVEASRAELAAMLRLPEAAIGARPLWVDTGSEQLIVPLASAEHVHAARPDAALLAAHAFSPRSREPMAYVWARAGAGPGAEAPEEAVAARFFFMAHGSLVEDPATGSACANLGGWCIATGAQLPLRLRVRQGEHVGRPSVLDLHVDAQRRVFVRGEVVEIGRGELEI